MNPKDLANIKAIAIRLAYEINPTSQLDDLLKDAELIFNWLMK